VKQKKVKKTNTLQTIKKVAMGLLLLSFGSFAVTPIASFLGIDQIPVQNVAETIKFILLMVGVVIVFALLAILGLGYLALTGWRDYKKFSIGLRLIVAFSIGIIIVALSSPISIVLPIPFLPLSLSALLIWGTLRGFSNALNNNDKLNMKINDAIITSKDLVNDIEPNSTENVEVIDSRIDKKCWRVLLLSSNSGKKYEVQIDKQTGDVTNWKFLY
jgi:hypothetical protein